MRLTSLFLSMVMLVQLVCLPVPASAAVSYENEKFSGTAPVNKVGKLLIAEGIATLSATSIEISSTDSSGKQTTELKGRLIQSDRFGKNVKGLAFFNEGPALSKLDAAACDEYVKKIDGTKVSGPVRDVTDSSVNCGGQTIPMDRVSEIHSARVFKYTTKLGDGAKLNLNATCAKLKGKMTMKQKVIIGTVAVLLIAGIACAIAIPIAVSSGGGSKPQPFFPVFPNQQNGSPEPPAPPSSPSNNYNSGGNNNAG